MSHSVHFRDAAGEIQLEDTATLEEALERVERLRNDEDATELRVFREVPIEVRTYYRVTAVDDASASGSPPAPRVAEAAEIAASDAAVVGPVATIDPPSGAMMMSPPPVATVPGAPSPDAGATAESGSGDHRRQLFGRG